MSLEALIAILGMAAVTFAIRAGGLLLANRLPSTGFVANWLKHVPGAVLAALIAPALFAVAPGKPLADAILPAETAAALVVVAIYVASRNLFAAMAGGVLAVYLMRLWLGA
jgi:branched-subunit amino acid transport protein